MDNLNTNIIMSGRGLSQRARSHRETTGFERLFSAHASQKSPGIRQVFPDFSVLPERKNTRSKLFHTSKEGFLCPTRRKAQEYWICIPSIFNDVRRKKILLRLPYPCVNTPKGSPFVLSNMNHHYLHKKQEFCMNMLIHYEPGQRLSFSLLSRLSVFWGIENAVPHIYNKNQATPSARRLDQ